MILEVSVFKWRWGAGVGLSILQSPKRPKLIEVYKDLQGQGIENYNIFFEVSEIFSE